MSSTGAWGLTPSALGLLSLPAFLQTA